MKYIHISPCEHSPPERRISNDSYTKFATGLHEADFLVLDVKGERGILDLYGCDGVDCMRASKRGGGDLAEPEIPYFAFPK